MTTDGVMDPVRRYESPYTDHGPTGPEMVFDEVAVDGIITILRTVKADAIATDGAA